MDAYSEPRFPSTTASKECDTELVATKGFSAAALPLGPGYSLSAAGPPALMLRVTQLGPTMQAPSAMAPAPPGTVLVRVLQAAGGRERTAR